MKRKRSSPKKIAIFSKKTVQKISRDHSVSLVIFYKWQLHYWRYGYQRSKAFKGWRKKVGCLSICMPIWLWILTHQGVLIEKSSKDQSQELDHQIVNRKNRAGCTVS